MASPKVFITGATGYIGGDFLYTAYHSHPEWSFSALVRNQEKAEILQEAFPNVRLVLGDLDSTDVLREEALVADIVLHFADCDHEESARAFIEGLKLHPAERPGWYIHTSGTGILTIEDGRAKTCGTHRTKVYDDWDGVSELLNLPDDAFHRNVDKIVTDTIAWPSKDFKTAIVCPCCIYGPGRGPGNTKSVQVYTLATTVLKRGKGIRIGDGENIWHQVHVQDLSNLYLALAEAAASGGSKATWDDEGYYLAENGSFSWGDVEKAVAQAVFEKGLINTSELDVLDWDDTDKVDPAGPYKWGSNSRGLATRASKLLGWKPVQPKLMDLIGDIVELQAQDLKYSHCQLNDLTFGNTIHQYYHLRMMDTTWVPRKPRLLAISLLHHEIHDEYWRPFYREAARYVTLQVATEPETAIQVLQQSTPPKVVLITDGGLARPENGHVWYSVLAYVHQGGTAIAMGFFSYVLVEAEVNSFFLLAGLNWRARACPEGLSAMLNRDADQVGSTGLPNDFICCQSFYLTEVGFHEAWYVGQPECKRLKYGETFFGPCCMGISVGVPAAFGKIGKGRLGYVGGHDPDCGSGDTVWAMCGLPPLYRKFFRKPMVAWSE